MQKISIYNPCKTVFGSNSIDQMAEDYIASGKKRIYILSVPVVIEMIQNQLAKLKNAGIEIAINERIAAEPTFSDFNNIIAEARAFKPDSVAGIGGGSVMDVAKLVAEFITLDKPLTDYVGIGLLPERKTHLVCAPTTSGTGSEVSPNSILMDDVNGGKKGIISPYLIPDASYIDPDLTTGLPPALTAYTGIDALTHCIEAYANKYAHPLIDTYAITGISLIAKNLKRAFDNGNDREARANLSMGSLLGGICLGPVNTGAVHALAYPLGNDYKIAHGLSNAVLLPYVMEFNLPEAEARYAEIALAMGTPDKGNSKDTALAGLELVKKLITDCNVPLKLREIGIKEQSIESMAESALLVQRLLKNNVREVTLQDAISIYTKAF